MESNNDLLTQTRQEMAEINSPGSYFQCRTIDQVCEDGSNTPARKKIVGAFLYQNSTTYLFSRTNYGKSLLAFQYAFAAATGTSFCEALNNECDPMKVLVVDLELEALDIYERHGKALENMKPEHIPNLLYLHEKNEVKVELGFSLLERIEAAAVQHKAELVIIDNVSKLLPDSLKPDLVTFVIMMLNRIRKKTGASILVIGHTTKGNPCLAIQPTDYFGSSMLQNFFSELSFLDMTKDGKFFLCHSKTKHAECYSQTVPLFSRGPHQKVGVGFNFETMRSYSDVQLPLMLAPACDNKKRDMAQYKHEMKILEKAGTKQARIAAMCNVNASTINRAMAA